MKPFNAKTAVYTLTVSDAESAELVMYGDIYEHRPIDWLTGEPVEGDFILLDDFLDDLDEIRGAKRLVIRMNSYGGDANVANVIHNRLRELSRGGMEIICIVDGAAMSGGSLIMCAADLVRVNPSSLIMIHNAWSFLFGGYSSAELLEAAASLEEYDRMQAAIYERKTGLSEREIRGMMEETTYMTGTEAVEKGFADELIEDAKPLRIAASADRRTLYIGARTLHLPQDTVLPDSIAVGESVSEWKGRMLTRLNKKED